MADNREAFVGIDVAKLKNAFVAWQLIVRMRSFRLGLAVNCESEVVQILKLTTIAPALRSRLL